VQCCDSTAELLQLGLEFLKALQGAHGPVIHLFMGDGALNVVQAVSQIKQFGTQRSALCFGTGFDFTVIEPPAEHRRRQ